MNKDDTSAWRGTTAQAFGIFIDLEREARVASSLNSLFFSMTNSTRRLFSFEQLIVFSISNSGSIKVESASNIPVLNNNSPFIQWLEKWIRRKKNKLDTPHAISGEKKRKSDNKLWSEWCPKYVWWQPLKDTNGKLLGGLWMGRDRAWQSPEHILLSHLAGCYGHAWAALINRSSFRKWFSIPIPIYKTILYCGMALLLFFLMFFPIRQSVLAPAEVIARHPHTITSPLNGVIKTIAVKPYQQVSKGDTLFTFDNTLLQAKVDLARHSLDLEIAKLEMFRQNAFLSKSAKSQIIIQEGEVKLQATKLKHAEKALNDVIVKAHSNGIAIFASEQNWVGRPVQIGEKILIIADVKQASLRIDLSIKDAINIPKHATVELFLAIEPLAPISATIMRHSYQAEKTFTGDMAFRLDAAFSEDSNPRIGLRGTAKIFGYKVPLYLYLFRKPIATIRQALGI